MNRIKKSKSEAIFDVMNFMLLAIFSFLAFYPFYYIFIYSISDPIKAMRGMFILPHGLTLTNYISIFSESNILHAALISLSRTVLGTILTIICCSMFAYGVTKKVLPFRKLMYRMLVLTMYFGSGLIPWYVTMKMYGLKNNYLVYILPMIIVPFLVVLIKTYMEQIPVSMEESALVDGANYFTIFSSIIMPLSMPILATVGIFQAVTQWNMWTDNFYICSSPKLLTLQLLLLSFLSEQSSYRIVNDRSLIASAVRVTPVSIRMTITVIVILPIFMVYPFMQKYFVKGIMIGAIKG